MGLFNLQLSFHSKRKAHFAFVLNTGKQLLSSFEDYVEYLECTPNVSSNCWCSHLKSCIRDKIVYSPVLVTLFEICGTLIVNAVCKKTWDGNYIWPHAVSDVHGTEEVCHDWAQDQTWPEYLSLLEPLAAANVVKLVAMDALQPLSKTFRSNWYIDVITKRYVILARCSLDQGRRHPYSINLLMPVSHTI